MIEVNMSHNSDDPWYTSPTLTIPLGAAAGMLAVVYGLGLPMNILTEVAKPDVTWASLLSSAAEFPVPIWLLIVIWIPCIVATIIIFYLMWGDTKDAFGIGQENIRVDEEDDEAWEM